MLQINFGKKIPIAVCQVQNTKTKNFEKATIYEYDCKDKSDLDELKKLAEKEFGFGYCILSNANKKANPTKAQHRNCRIYTIEDESKRTICMCDTNENEKAIVVKHIESANNKKYKYAGQNMLAMLARKVIQEGKRELFIFNIFDEAQEFYIDKCGFQTVKEPNIYNGKDLTMFRKDIPKFLLLTQEKTRTNTFDARG